MEYIQNLQATLDGDYDEVLTTPLQTKLENQVIVKEEAPEETPKPQPAKVKKPRKAAAPAKPKGQRGRKPKLVKVETVEEPKGPPPLTFHGASVACPTTAAMNMDPANKPSYAAYNGHQMAYTSSTAALTPRTPNSPDFGTTESGYDTASYASYGNSYYHGNPSPMHTPTGGESSCPPSPMPNLMAPPTTTSTGAPTCYPNQHMLVSPHQHHQSSMMYGNPRANSVSPVQYPAAASNNCDSYQQQQQNCFQQQQSSTYVKYPQPTPYGNPGMFGNTSSGVQQHQMMHSDEDDEDILDAIVKWQES